jgi:hypothetical protein
MRDSHLLGYTLALVFVLIVLVIQVSLIPKPPADPRSISEAEYMEASALCMGKGGVMNLRMALSDGSYTKFVNCKNGEEFQLNNIQEK